MSTEFFELAIPLTSAGMMPKSAEYAWLVEKEQPDGLTSKQVRPYLMDLGNTNGLFIDDNHIEPQHGIMNLKRILLGLAMVARNMYCHMGSRLDECRVEKPFIRKGLLIQQSVR
ncbi:hypothetical protein C4D60_Mb10t23600 [Musa balbisiana]|uniref:Uncharacterized protein n=1 Tax=Musa balbisiana TaxID=52838 RepID=A0A4S8IZ69_MUSBA|nr:hypothetical protein C4D60_Mb10t23600 [Musa balbisiana]